MEIYTIGDFICCIPTCDNWSTVKCKLLESTLLLGIDPSVLHVCVNQCVTSYLQLMVRIYSVPPEYTSDPSHTLAHTLLGAEGALFITVTFPFNTQPKSSYIHIHVSCAPC